MTFGDMYIPGACFFVAVIVGSIVAWSLCVVSSQADDEMEKMREREGNDGN